MYNLIAQAFGIIGLIFNVCCFQAKNNKTLFIIQTAACLMFSVNYFMIGAVAGVLFNISGLIRNLLFLENDKKIWKVIVAEGFLTFCFIFSLTFIIGNPLQIILSSLTFAGMFVTAFAMWWGDGKKIRLCQLFANSPAWLIHNIFNFTLGGIIGELLNMSSVIVSLFRFRKEGFEK